MNNFIEYKGYYTNVQSSPEDHILHGKIEGIRDLVNFECESASEVEEKFHEAIDDYLAFCEDMNRMPERPCKVFFNIRVTPEIHRQAAIKTSRDN